MTRPTREPSSSAGALAPSGLSSLFEPYVWAWFIETFKQPSPPQVESWPRIAAGKNTLILAPTGSGKTLAAFLWCINDLFRRGREQTLQDSIHVLYISPLKALNNDVHKNLVEPLRGIRETAERMGIAVPPVRSMVRTGDTTAQDRARMARQPPHILITTPESLYIILATPRFREAFRTVRYVIVDEIHALSDNKRGVHLSLSLERLQHLVPEPLVRIGLSATQKPLDEIARFLAGMDDRRGGPPCPPQPRPCETVDIGARKNLDVRVLSPVDDLLEAHFDAIWGSTYDQMLSLIRQHDTTLIFANSRYKTERTALRLNELGQSGDTVPHLEDNPSAPGPRPEDRRLAVGAHHGSMSRKVRLDMEDQLKRGELDALVATASLELGIDVGSIDLVCQIQSCKSVSVGMQRIGRAGHLLDATSKGRLLVTDRDDLVESAVLVKAIVEGEIDTTRIPTNCLDVLAQQIVGAVAADPWDADQLFDLCRRSYCYRDLDRQEYDRVLDMLSGGISLDMEHAPYPKILWDKVNNILYPERGTRLIAYRASGTIPDVADYEVYLEKRQTRVGQLDEGFVEELHTGDIFILGSSSWRVLRIHRNRVIVEDVYGLAPTIPFWGGDRSSRTYDLGVLVGRFRRFMGIRMAAETDTEEASADREGTKRVGLRALPDGDLLDWIQSECYTDEKGARAICQYMREQQQVTGLLPSDQLVLIESFRNELGLQQIVIHSSFGVRVNEPWAMAIAQGVEARCGFRPPTATTDDGILVTIPADRGAGIPLPTGPEDNGWLLEWVHPDSLDECLSKAILDPSGRGVSAVFASRFRHNAVRSLMVLREYQGRRTPVWLQSQRASALLDACRHDTDFPLIRESLRECFNEALDVPNLRRVLNGLASGEIQVRVVETRIPSPFTHSLLLLGQYGDMGSIPTRERRSRLMHLHRELLKQILDQETLRNLLDEGAVNIVQARLQRWDPKRRARDANELARMLLDLGDLVEQPDEELSLLDRVEENAGQMLAELVADHRAILVPIPTAETNGERWISAENYPLYRAAFSIEVPLDDADRQLLQALDEAKGLPLPAGAQSRLDKLVHSYHVLRLPGHSLSAPGPQDEDRAEYVAASTWLPEHILSQRLSRQEARLTLVARLLHSTGPVTKYEIMERYGFAEPFVEWALASLQAQGHVARGEYVPYKSLPQWCYKPNLEEIHRLTLNRLRKEMEPATPEEYADFLLRWQHLHPDTQLSGLDGLRQIIRQIQGLENYQIVYERDVFPSRVKDYHPSLLDRLCYSGEVFWRRFDYKTMRRGQIGFCFRHDRAWLVTDPQEVEMRLDQWDDDIHEACDAVRQVLRERGACFFDDIVQDAGLDWRLALRAIWHLVWTGEATNDSFESIRHAGIASGLSACYDLATKPGRKGVTLDFIVRHMLENRHLDPRLGRWAPTERLAPGTAKALDRDEMVLNWAHLLLGRYGVVSQNCLKGEVAAPGWKELRRALIRLEILGQVQRGFFVQELSGEQYADPRAVDALRETKLRHPDDDRTNAAFSAHGSRDGGSTGTGAVGTGTGGAGTEPRPRPVSIPDTPEEAIYPDEPMILVNACDPANPFGALFRARTQAGEELSFMRMPQKALVIQAGQPILLYEGNVTLLTDLSKERAEEAIRTLLTLADPSPGAEHEIYIRDWNGHPTDVSPARHLLLKLGFVQVSNRWKGFVYDPVLTPTQETLDAAEREIPAVFEHVGQEEAPVAYDAEWIISRSLAEIRPQVRRLIDWLQKNLASEFELHYGPRQMTVRYRGCKCATPYVQQKQIWLQIAHKGWTRGILIQPDTDLGTPEFAAKVLEQFHKTRQQIDLALDGGR